MAEDACCGPEAGIEQLQLRVHGRSFVCIFCS